MKLDTRVDNSVYRKGLNAGGCCSAIFELTYIEMTWKK
jgi:hypothetical protein